jgi:hypothetical protein
MRAYVITTGIAFALLTAVHVWRIVSEDSRLAANPPFVAITLVCAAFAVWAGFVLARLPRRRGRPAASP